MSIEDRSTLVFASGIGRVKEEKPKAERPQGDGVVRIQLKRLGGGKMSSVVTGIPLAFVCWWVSLGIWKKIDRKQATKLPEGGN